MDYNKYLEINKHKIYKKLLRLEEIKPNDKLELLQAIETPNDKKSKWEMELLFNSTILCYWRVSGSMFEQICRHNRTNNTNIFYLQPDRKVRVGRSPTWLLKISSSPIGITIDATTPSPTIKETIIPTGVIDMSKALNNWKTLIAQYPSTTSTEKRVDTAVAGAINAFYNANPGLYEGTNVGCPLNDKHKLAKNLSFYLSGLDINSVRYKFIKKLIDAAEDR